MKTIMYCAAATMLAAGPASAAIVIKDGAKITLRQSWEYAGPANVVPFGKPWTATEQPVFGPGIRGSFDISAYINYEGRHFLHKNTVYYLKNKTTTARAYSYLNPTRTTLISKEQVSPTHEVNHYEQVDDTREYLRLIGGRRNDGTSGVWGREESTTQFQQPKASYHTINDGGYVTQNVNMGSGYYGDVTTSFSEQGWHVRNQNLIHYEVYSSGGDMLHLQEVTFSFELEKIMSLVPEPGTWMMMIAGFGAIGGALRGRGRRAAGILRTA